MNCSIDGTMPRRARGRSDQQLARDLKLRAFAVYAKEAQNVENERKPPKYEFELRGDVANCLSK